MVMNYLRKLLMNNVLNKKNDLEAGKQTQVVTNNTANIQSKLTLALMYAKNNFNIFPCKPNSKIPAISGWKEVATCDFDTIKAWWRQNPEYNIGVVADRHIVLDVDIKPEDAIDGFTSLEQHPELPITFTVNTPSGGKHYYFDTNDALELTICQGFEPGLDIRAGGKGYSIGIGSSINGVRYSTTSETFDVAVAPDWVLEAATKKRSVSAKLKLQVTSNHVSKTSLADIAEILTYIDPDLDYEQWINIGMAIHSEYPGGQGLELWDGWSSEGEKYQLNECEKHWGGFDDGKGITIATLFYYAPDYLKSKNGCMELQNIYGENDTTLAEFLINQHQSSIVYHSTLKQWLVFNDGAWVNAEDAKRLVFERYKQMVNVLKQHLQSGRYVPMSMKWLNNAMNHANYRSVLKIVETQLSIGVDKLDANPNLIGLKTNVYDMSTDLLRPATSDDLVIKSLGTSHDKNATCPNWEKFILVAMQNDKKMVDYLQRLVGYFLTTSIREQQIFFFYGSGANGKSTFLDLVKALLGDYAIKINSDVIMKGNSGGRSNAVMAGIANLAGIRLAITDEMDDNNAAFDTQTLKSLSGDDEVTGRHLYSNPVTFKSTAKIVMYGNDKPYGNINDEGFWRRMRFIHFGYVVPQEHRDPNLLSTLKSEMPGIFNWALHGLAEWKRQGLNAPEKVVNDSAEYKKELDSITEYFDDNIEYQPNCVITSKTLFEGYVNWCNENLLTPEQRASFNRKCGQYFKPHPNVSHYKTNKNRGYKGVYLK